EPAERVLDLEQSVLQLVELHRLMARGRAAPDALELQLCSRQELERIVVQRAGESPPGLVASGGDVVEQMPACGHGLLEANRRVAELVLRLLVLPQQTCGHPDQAQDPEVVAGETA